MPVDSRNFIHRALVTCKKYPSLSVFDDMDEADELSLYADGPWVQQNSVVDSDLLHKYVGGDDWFPGNIPLDGTEKDLWRQNY